MNLTLKKTHWLQFNKLYIAIKKKVSMCNSINSDIQQFEKKEENFLLIFA